MAKPSPPRMRPEELPRLSEDEVERHMVRTYFALVNDCEQISEGSLNEAWSAFAALASVFPLLHAGLPHESIKNAYPFPHWQENTVEVPAEMLRPLVESYREYLRSETQTLGQSFGFEASNRQGRRPMKMVARKIDEARNLAVSVELRYRKFGDEPGVAISEIYAVVAEENGVSERTVERAYARFRCEITDNLRTEARPRNTPDNT